MIFFQGLFDGVYMIPIRSQDFTLTTSGGRCKLQEDVPFRVCSTEEVRAWEETRSERLQRAVEVKERRLASPGDGVSVPGFRLPQQKVPQVGHWKLMFLMLLLIYIYI